MYTFETKPGLSERMIDVMPHPCVPIADVFDAMAEGMCKHKELVVSDPFSVCCALARAWIELFMWPIRALL